MDQERIIYILDYLSRYTDEKKSVSIKEIQDHLPFMLVSIRGSFFG